MMPRHQQLFLLLLAASGVLLASPACGSDGVEEEQTAGSPRKLLAATRATKIEVTDNAARLARVIARAIDVQLITTGSKKPLLTAPPGTTGIITWDQSDKHELRAPNWRKSVVLSTGEARRAISTARYTGEKPPSYRDITNVNIPKSHDVVVLDFWIKVRTDGDLSMFFWTVTNEGYKLAQQLHGDKAAKARDVVQVDFLGVGMPPDKSTFKVFDPKRDAPRTNETNVMQYSNYRQERALCIAYVGDVFRIKIRVADTGDRLVDSAVLIDAGALGTEFD